jgi:hypothetical protein
MKTVIDSTMPQPLLIFPQTAATIAQERLHRYLMEKVADEWDDLALYEFYSWLLKQAKYHAVDRSGFISNEYKSDKEQAKKME